MASHHLLLLLLLLPAAAAAVVVVILLRSKWQSSTTADVENPPTAIHFSRKATDVKSHTWEEVRAMTADFTSPVIAHGGYSTVYLASGDEASSSFAVKVHNESERLHAAFLEELDVLLHVRHANIARLVGFSAHGERGALLFHLEPRGTLHEHLHGGGAPLRWADRMRIALQLAAALEYLHERCELQVVHNDVKSSNVLLDGELNCKLCDFGSAARGFSSAVHRRERHLTGTAGYVDPYYLRTGVLSRKSDVYSFGVVLLEIVTGREAFCPEKCVPLPAAMRAAVREAADGRGGEMVDVVLEGAFDVGQAAAVAAVVEDCVADDPSRRPSMGEVVSLLKKKV